MKLLALAAAIVPLCSCSLGYVPPYFPPAPPVINNSLPYDGPSKVTVIDHGVVPAGIHIRSTPSSYSGYSGYSSGYSGDSFESPYAWSFPDQSPCYSSGYSGYGYGNYTPYRNYSDYGNYGHKKEKGFTPFFPGSDYGYSSYREATSGSASRRRSR